MHAGQYATPEHAVAHYSGAPRAPSGHSELKAPKLSPVGRRELLAFLRALSGPLSVLAGHLEAPPPATR